MHFHNSSAKKCRFSAKNWATIDKNCAFYSNDGLSYAFFTWFWVMQTSQMLLVPAASNGCQNMLKESVMAIFWQNLCNQYRGLPRQILLFIWSKNMFFRLVSASLGQIWTFLRRVFRRPVNVALKEGWYMRVYEGIWVYMRVYEGIWVYMRVYDRL